MSMTKFFKSLLTRSTAPNQARTVEPDQPWPRQEPSIAPLAGDVIVAAARAKAREPVIVDTLAEVPFTQQLARKDEIPLVRLTRTESSSHGTFGIIRYEDFTSYTLELPWVENAGSISCIPKGSYNVIWTYSPRFKRYMFLVDGVPGRTGIRFHSANLAGDTRLGLKSHLHGCIALGERIGVMGKQKALLLSAPMVIQFENLLHHNRFRLIIDGIVG